MKKLQKYFYSHLIDDDVLETELDILEISDTEKDDLMELSHVHVHQTVMDAILSVLGHSDKQRFMELVAEGEDEQIWEHLNEKVDNIEDKITVAAKQIKKELRKDIKKTKSSK